MTITVPPPAAEACLTRAYSSSQKGGTLIAEEVRDLVTHALYLSCPDRYRPAACPRCGAGLHIHGTRVRCLLGDPAGTTEIIRFCCSDRGRCGAVWQVVPAFLARHLWRRWETVEKGIERGRGSPVPARTRRRWRTRLAASARHLVVALTTAASDAWNALALAVGLACSRLELVRAYRAARTAAPCLSELAGLIHRLAPGHRLM